MRTQEIPLRELSGIWPEKSLSQMLFRELMKLFEEHSLAVNLFQMLDRKRTFQCELAQLLWKLNLLERVHYILQILQRHSK